MSSGSKWMPGLVLALGAASTLLLIGINFARDVREVRDGAITGGLSEVQLSAATAHLWVEEYVTGDSVELAVVLRRLDRAKEVVSVLRDGGRLDADRAELPELDDVELRRRLEVLVDQLGQFSAMSNARIEGYGAGEDVGIGSLIDIRYDQLFDELNENARFLSAAFDERSTDHKVRLRLVFRAVLVGWVLLVALAATGLWTRERRRLQAVEALRTSERQLFQSQKLEAVGRLAGGIAHDINNYLAAVTAQCEVILMKGEVDERVAAKLTTVLGSTEKASELIRRLLAFSRRQPIQPEVVRLSDVVAELEPLMARLLGEDIRLTTKLADDLWNVEIDPAQFEQIVVNLLVNAREAMPTGGDLAITMGNVTGSESENEFTSSSGEYVMLAVSDTGRGIPPEIHSQIFEPFFTTKGGAESSGLGLAMVHGIVEQNRGLISLQSEIDTGSTFKILLPRSHKVASAIAPKRPADGPRSQGRESILLAEDNPELRSSIREALESFGYDVATGENGTEAIQLFEACEGDFDLVITDLVMPDISGVQVVEKIREYDPEARFIVISGYSDHPMFQHGVEGGEMLAKPFSIGTLLRKIREVLDRD